MNTHLSYTMAHCEDGYLARCDELSLEALGESPEAAMAALKTSIEQHLTSVEAMAPPSRPPPPPHIELEIAAQPVDDFEK
jgi:predicted RNase H-like HicB family nuclease